MKLKGTSSGKIKGVDTSSAYCSLKLGNTQKTTRCIDFAFYPHWDQLFYFDVPSYATSELIIQVLNKLSKDAVLQEIIIPIRNLKRGVVERSKNTYLDIDTHLIGPMKSSFLDQPFETNKITIQLENMRNNTNIYCMVKLKGDEYWQFTRPGNFNDFFSFEYIDQHSLIIKSSDGTNFSDEKSIDIDEPKDDIVNTSMGKFKLSFVKDNNLENSPSVMAFNIYITSIQDIKIEKGVLWSLKINNQSSGYTYDGIINKYFSFPVNSLISDEFKVTLYREEKGKKKEYGTNVMYIKSYHIGNLKEDIITLSKGSIFCKVHISLPDMKPFIDQIYKPLIMHICIIEAFNFPSKMDTFVSCRLERDKQGVNTQIKEKTTNPQYYEFIHFTITDEKEDLIVEMFSKNGKNKIGSSQLKMDKYLNGEICYEWIKMDRIVLNIAIQIKREGENYMSMDDIDKYISNTICDIN